MATRTPVTRPTIPNFDIASAFRDYGYEPSQEEIDALAPTFGGRINPGERGRAAVADYVRTMKMEQERQANDPLKKFIEGQEPKIGEYEKQAQDVIGQLKKIISGAPQLFGSMTEDQVDQYLAPLQRATAESSARIEGAFARRGLLGSTPESQALAEQERQFRENTLSAGLTVGQQQQQLQAQTMQNILAQLYGQAGQIRGLVGQGTGQLSSQDLQQLQFLAGLPLLQRGIAAQERALADANQKKTDWGSIGSLAGMGLGAALAPFTGGMSLPLLMGVGGSLGGAVGNIAGGNTAGGAAAAGQIPWWLMMRPNATSTTSLTPTGAVNSPSSYGFTSGGTYNA